MANNIYERFRYYERNRAAQIQKIFSSLPNQGKQEATLSLYSGRICGSEGKNWRPCGFLAKSLLSAFYCLLKMESYED